MKDVIQAGIGRENLARKIYSSYSQMFDSGPIKELFEYLCMEAQRHAGRLEEIMDYEGE